MKTCLAIAAALATAVATPAAAAQFTFSFVTTGLPFGGPTQTANGIFTTADVASTDLGPDVFKITGISGTINGVAITGLATVIGIDSYNYFAAGSRFLDGTGVRFDTDTFKDVSLFAPDFGPTPYSIRGNGTIIAYGDATSSAIAAVPEPATWALLIIGFAMAGAALRYRRRPVAVRA